MKTSKIDATSFMYAFGVKNTPSAKILRANSKLIKITNTYSANCNAGVSITRYKGVSNIIEIQDKVVTQIINQSKYVTRPRKLLIKASKLRNNEFG